MDFAKARKFQASFAELRKIRRVEEALEGENALGTAYAKTILLSAWCRR